MPLVIEANIIDKVTSEAESGEPIKSTIFPITLPINNDEDYQYELENIIEKTARTFSLNNQNQKDNKIDEIKISWRKIFPWRCNSFI